MRKAEITQITSLHSSLHTQTTRLLSKPTHKAPLDPHMHSKSQNRFLHLPPPKLFLSARRRCACLQLRCAGTSMHEAGDPQPSLHLDPQVNETQATIHPFVFPRLHLHDREWGSKEYLWVLRAHRFHRCFILELLSPPFCYTMAPRLIIHMPFFTIFLLISPCI